jgi:tripartite-type tricarboxylate transporter receptor subunit TctC
MTRKFTAALIISCLAITSAMAQSGPAYPSRSVTILVPTGAGSAPDLLARKIGQQLSEKLGQPFVIDNRPGAAGMIGAAAVAKSQPDGHTLLLAWDGMMAINPILYRQISYNVQKDFVPVTTLGRVEFVLVAHPSFAPNSVAEFIATAKASPRKIDYASAGIGEVHHIAMEALAAQAGIQLSHVPYKGGPAALNDILGGHVPIGFIGLTPALPLLKDGKLKALATLGTARSQHLPSVPTVAETLAGFSIQGSWLGLFAPYGTPSATVVRLNEETNKLLKDKVISEFLVSQGIIPMGSSPAEFAQLIQDDTARFREIIEKLGIRIE